MKEFIDKLIERLEEIEVENSCYGCTYRTQCNAVQEKVSDETDLCGATIKEVAIEIVNQLAEEHKDDIQTIDVSELLGAQGNDGWIPVEQRLPEDCDNRFYMCIVENHEEDLPMFCQYDENYGFGF